MSRETSKIIPVLLSGGTGTRLWPLSREAYPKQFLPLVDHETLLQQAALRTLDRAQFGSLIVVANADHRFVIAEQLRTFARPTPRIVLEPFGRNTAPAAAVAALLAEADDPDALILLMPADHVISDAEAFLAAVAAGEPAARNGSLVLFGIQPANAATGYGYIQKGDVLESAPSTYSVRQFVEKPDQPTAERYLESGDFLWNSGIFLLPARRFLDELQIHAPAVLAAARAAVANSSRDMDFLRLDGDAFSASPSISIDYAVFEKSANCAVVPTSMPWTDVGSYSALWDIGEKDAAGNVGHGDVFLQDSRNCYVRSEGPLVATLGVDDLVVVATSDVVLVVPKSRDQDIKQIVEHLKAKGKSAATQTVLVHRPWGFYQSVHSGDRFQVKQITVNPGGKLSLQKHHHRAEHWVVVHGTAQVTRDDEKFLVYENQSVFLPLGCVHRLENPGLVPLKLIEVQSGSYLGEDDIVRLEDIYARA
ncbi:mannose-1-phosphate guanylyltransferase/mannose-6-phosphate isomerase [Flaviflagellibacter deserti]|uniref:mannose-1-phosphate guanylyltransferase n=1 Tax=Flaviflagellibacter deserti TaxID=2267266 RepID=A0ABV9Z1Q4_9HYPH